MLPLVIFVGIHTLNMLKQYNLNFLNMFNTIRYKWTIVHAITFLLSYFIVMMWVNMENEN